MNNLSIVLSGLIVVLAVPAGAETFTVDRIDDPDPASIGACDDAIALDCSLRKAVIISQIVPAGPHTVFVPEGIYRLTREGSDNVGEFGGLDVSTQVFLRGAGEGLSVVSVNDFSVIDVFETAVGVEISDMTLRDAAVGIRNSGELRTDRLTLTNHNSRIISGGLFNMGTLEVFDTNIFGNAGWGVRNDGTLRITDSVVAENGGAGIRSVAGGVLIVNSTIASNSQTDLGPGIDVQESSLTIVGSLVADNQGSGVRHSSSTLTITDSTVSGNGLAPGVRGGGVRSLSSSSNSVEIVNSTFTGNGGQDGVIDVDGGTLRVDRVTIVGNIGLNSISSPLGTNVEIRGSVLDTICSGPAASFVSLGGNVGRFIGCGFDLAIDSAVIGSLGLAPLGQYGGTTPTMPPLPGSPAIDFDPPGGCPPPGTDQRGLPRSAGPTCDAGAVEYQGSGDPANRIFADSFE